uniref:Uncharacterized protein n=1 Tax=Sinocyclocheilus grahami TaxID=75366 RepID=A0A672MMK8_SINGR
DALWSCFAKKCSICEIHFNSRQSLKYCFLISNCTLHQTAFLSPGAETKRYFTCSTQLLGITASDWQTDHRTCSTGRPLHQLSNVKCFQETSVHVMSIHLCVSCSVPAVNSIFFDPCVGTYKYLDVSYLHLPFSKSIYETHYHSKIGVGNGVIRIHHANYGQQDLVTCPLKLATTPNLLSSDQQPAFQVLQQIHFIKSHLRHQIPYTHNSYF